MPDTSELERELTDIFRQMEKADEPGQSLVDDPKKWTEFFVLKTRYAYVRHQPREAMRSTNGHV